jgi:hypothetical protein
VWFAAEKIKPTLERIADALEALATTAGRVRFILNRPGQITFEAVGQRKVGKMSFIQFKIVLPPVADADAVDRELSVQIGDGEPEVESVGIETREVYGHEGPQDSTVRLSLVNIDDAANRSEPSVLEAVLTDTVPPAQPGELAIVATGERPEEEEPQA